jgi:hypothetical protein
VPHNNNNNNTIIIINNNSFLELFTNTSCTQKSIKMGYDDSVYLAKLAEQAERYEGEHSHHPSMAGWKLT